MTYYDPKKECLIFVGNNPTPKFWDAIWKSQLKNQNNFLKKIDLLVSPTTKKFLKPKSKILEGGCGHGTYVDILNKLGYHCIGVDFAKSTIENINRIDPGLPIFYGDLTRLKYKNSSFDGYWSLGVIEHFYRGFEPILSEMKRIVRKKGFVFVTFPYMSPLRKLKARLGKYHRASFKQEPNNFYQFALNHQRVIKAFEKQGFKIVMEKPYDGVSGLRKEIPQLGFILNPLSIYSTKYLPVAGARFIISKITERFTSHSTLLVFQRV